MVLRLGIFLGLCYATTVLALRLPRQADGRFWWKGPNPGPQDAKPSDGRSLDDLIKEVFGTGGPTSPLPAVEGKQVDTPEINASPNVEPRACGTCVPYYLCQNDTVITDGTGLIDIRQGPGVLGSSPCGNYLEVCCKAPQTEPITPPPRIIQGCGFRNEDGVGFRITGDQDNESQFGEFPWMVAVLRAETVEPTKVINVYQCGGALILPDVVLTAAHCVAGKDPRLLRIRAGEWDTQTRNELYPHEDRNVTNFVIHEQYYAGALFNDVALLFLDHPVSQQPNINTICLPPEGAVFDHSRCFASGWGKDVFGKEGKYQVILKKVELPVVPRPQCQESLRRTRLGPYFKLHDSFICAGGEPGRDTCKGDGGSPLVCPIENQPGRYAQAGIVAWGVGCGENETPGVYVNVAQFHNWIVGKLQLSGRNSEEFTI